MRLPDLSHGVVFPQRGGRVGGLGFAFRVPCLPVEGLFEIFSAAAIVYYT